MLTGPRATQWLDVPAGTLLCDDELSSFPEFASLPPYADSCSFQVHPYTLALTNFVAYRGVSAELRRSQPPPSLRSSARPQKDHVLIPLRASDLGKREPVLLAGRVVTQVNETCAPDGGPVVKRVGPVVDMYFSGWEKDETLLMTVVTEYAEYVLRTPSVVSR